LSDDKTEDKEQTKDEESITVAGEVLPHIRKVKPYYLEHTRKMKNVQNNKSSRWPVVD
jgi:hypothetical protein